MLAVLELIDQVCGWRQADERIHDLLGEYIRCDPIRDPVSSFLFFEYHLLGVLGVQPDFTSCARCGARIDQGFYSAAEGATVCGRHGGRSPGVVPVKPELVEVVRRVERTPLTALCEVALERGTRKNLGKVIHSTYTYHVHGYTLPEALKLIPKDQ